MNELVHFKSNTKSFSLCIYEVGLEITDELSKLTSSSMTNYRAPIIFLLEKVCIKFTELLWSSLSYVLHLLVYFFRPCRIFTCVGQNARLSSRCQLGLGFPKNRRTPCGRNF